MSDTGTLPTPASVRRLILKNRKPSESRNAQAKRLDIPETSLRAAEGAGKLPRNPHVRAAFLAAFGVKS